MKKPFFLLISIFFFILVFNVSSASATCTPPAEGAWVINSGEECVLDSTTAIVPSASWDGWVGGYIPIYVRGNLILKNSTLRINHSYPKGVVDERHGDALVVSGSVVMENSKIIFRDEASAGAIFLHPNATAKIIDSELRWITVWWGGGSARAEIINSKINTYLHQLGGHTDIKNNSYVEGMGLYREASANITNSIIGPGILRVGSQIWSDDLCPSKLELYNSIVEGSIWIGCPTVAANSVIVDSKIKKLFITNSKADNSILRTDIGIIIVGTQSVTAVQDSTAMGIAFSFSGDTNVVISGIQAGLQNKLIKSTTDDFKVEMINTNLIGFTSMWSGFAPSSAVGYISLSGNSQADVSNMLIDTYNFAPLALENNAKANFTNMEVKYWGNPYSGYAWVFGNANANFNNFKGAINVYDNAFAKIKDSAASVALKNYRGVTNAVAEIYNSNLPFLATEGNSQAKLFDSTADSYASQGQITENSKVIYNRSVQKHSGNWWRLSGTPTLSFKDSVLALASVGLRILGNATNINMDGTISISYDSQTAGVWENGALVTREYPVYAAVPGAEVTVKNPGGEIVWTGTSDSEGWVYPKAVFNNSNYNLQWVVIASKGSEVKSTIFNFFSSTPLKAELSAVVGEPCKSTDYACKTIDSSGGCVESTDGEIKLCIPQGALSQATNIKINKVDKDTATIWIKGGWVVQRFFKIEPPGITFSIPAILTIKYTLENLKQSPSPNSLGIWHSSDNMLGSWSRLGGSLNTIDNTLTTQLNSLSFDAVAEQDATPPVTTASLNCAYEASPFSDWCKDSVEISLSASDEPVLNQESGIQKTHYSFDNNGNWSDYAAAFSIDKKGVNKLYYRSIDKADNAEEAKILEIKIDKDSDGDGVYDNFDECPANAGKTEWAGCPAAIKVQFDRHTVPAGSGVKPSSKVGINDAPVYQFDKSAGSCAAKIGISPKNYEAILEKCNPVKMKKTNNSGSVLIGSLAGNYLLIGRDPVTKVLTGVAASDLINGQMMEKYLQVIVRDDGSSVPAKATIKSGGAGLAIIEPEYIIWDDNAEIYPIILASYDKWNGEISLNSNKALQVEEKTLAFETPGTKSVQFRVLNNGKVPQEAKINLALNDSSGNKSDYSSVIGVRLTQEFAKAKKVKIDQYGNISSAVGASAVLWILLIIGGAAFVVKMVLGQVKR